MIDVRRILLVQRTEGDEIVNVLLGQTCLPFEQLLDEIDIELGDAVEENTIATVPVLTGQCHGRLHRGNEQTENVALAAITYSLNQRRLKTKVTLLLLLLANEQMANVQMTFETRVIQWQGEIDLFNVTVFEEEFDELDVIVFARVVE